MLTDTQRNELLDQAVDHLYETVDESPQLRPYRKICVRGSVCLSCMIGSLACFDFRRRARRFTHQTVHAFERVRRGRRGDKRRNIRTSPCTFCGLTKMSYVPASRLVSRILEILEPETAKRFQSRRQWNDRLARVYARYSAMIGEMFEDEEAFEG